MVILSFYLFLSGFLFQMILLFFRWIFVFFFLVYTGLIILNSSAALGSKLVLLTPGQQEAEACFHE